MKCKQPHLEFAFGSPYLFLTTISVTPLYIVLSLLFILYIYIYIYIYHNHHHHVMPLARISLTLSHHFSRSFIASGRSLGLLPVSSHSCCMYVRAGPPAFAWPYAGVHRSTSLMSSSLLLHIYIYIYIYREIEREREENSR